MEHTHGPWRLGSKGSVVADTPPENYLPGSDAVEYYGGYLICESVTEANAKLIAAAPDLLEIAKEIQFESNRNCLGPVIRKALDATITKATE